ncbi:MAG: hypothetical protein ACK4SJ_06170 [Sphingorhabdus sp.]
MAQIIPFPGKVRRGRKRVTSYVRTSGGDLALLMIQRQGATIPDKIVRLLEARDRRLVRAESGEKALMLAHLLFSQTGATARNRIRHMLDMMCYSQHHAPQTRLAALELAHLLR